MLVGPGHSFEQLAEAIDAAFARWDLSHLHAFRSRSLASSLIAHSRPGAGVGSRTQYGRETLDE